MPATAWSIFHWAHCVWKKQGYFFHTVHFFQIPSHVFTTPISAHSSIGNLPLLRDRPEATPSPGGATAARCTPEAQTATQIPTQNNTTQATKTPRHLRTSPPPPQTFRNDPNCNRNQIENYRLSRRKMEIDQNDWKWIYFHQRDQFFTWPARHARLVGKNAYQIQM